MTQIPAPPRENFPVLEVQAARIKDWGIPASLLDVPDPPLALYVQGRPDALELLRRLPNQGLAVVGARRPQPRSLNLVRKSIHALGNAPLVIVSGFARGIDSVAHAAAIEAGLPTIAILGCGHAIPYPHQNQGLRTKILESGGLLVSEFCPDAAPRPHFFLLRNRLIAHWTQATWVAEAASKSGALNTAAWAMQAHRTVFATPCYPEDSPLQGNQRLIDRDLAVPFWGPHSLGSVWLELSALPDLTEKETGEQGNKNSNWLSDLVRAKTIQEGGISLFDLDSWARSQQLDPLMLQQQLSEALGNGLIFQHLGTLFSKIG